VNKRKEEAIPSDICAKGEENDDFKKKEGEEKEPSNKCDGESAPLEEGWRGFRLLSSDMVFRKGSLLSRKLLDSSPRRLYS